MALDDIYRVRQEKIARLREAGKQVYPANSNRTISISDLRSQIEGGVLPQGEETLDGRIMAIRGQGAIVFFDLFDGTGTFQAVVQKDTVGNDEHELFVQNIDIGDFVEVTGALFTTKQGEPTVQAQSWRMLSKSLRPLPEKWHGLKDPDTRYRYRYLDMLLDSEQRALFRRHAQFWQEIRSFLLNEGFLEVETPMLEHTTGGAEACPFRTHHNDFGLDVFLRISVGELWQKRLLAAGFEKVFEVGRVFRNEGSSQEHVQEFTNAEFYAAYMNVDEGKDLLVRMYRTIAQNVYGTTAFSTRGHTFDLSDEWRDIDYVDTVKDMTGVDVLTASEEEMKTRLDELGVRYEGENRERLMDVLWKYCRKKISGPAFLVGHPKLVAPLSKSWEDNPEKTHTLQVILAGSELSRAHAELNDPLEQRARFEEQQKLLEAGDEEAMMPDWDFIEAMEHGFPPMFGSSFGLRMFAFMEDKPIREIQMFPLMRPKHE